VFLKHKLFVNRVIPCNRRAKGRLVFLKHKVGERA